MKLCIIHAEHVHIQICTHFNPLHFLFTEAIVLQYQILNSFILNFFSLTYRSLLKNFKEQKLRSDVLPLRIWGYLIFEHSKVTFKNSLFSLHRDMPPNVPINQYFVHFVTILVLRHISILKHCSKTRQYIKNTFHHHQTQAHTHTHIYINKKVVFTPVGNQVCHSAAPKFLAVGRSLLAVGR